MKCPKGVAKKKRGIKPEDYFAQGDFSKGDVLHVYNEESEEMPRANKFLLREEQ